jgi:antitoxin ParD1/3/4
MTGDACLTPAHLKADIDAGLVDATAGRVKDFDATRIVERGRKLLVVRSPSAREAP